MQPANNLGKTTTVFGRIMKQSGTYVLVESASKEHYSLDDQKTAKKYAGRAVFITGTMDVASKSIHVQRIEAAA
jgi:N-acetylneuraminic acid mutarotase